MSDIRVNLKPGTHKIPDRIKYFKEIKTNEIYKIGKIRNLIVSDFHRSVFYINNRMFDYNDIVLLEENYES